MKEENKNKMCQFCGREKIKQSFSPLSNQFFRGKPIPSVVYFYECSNDECQKKEQYVLTQEYLRHTYGNQIPLDIQEAMRECCKREEYIKP